MVPFVGSHDVSRFSSRSDPELLMNGINGLSKDFLDSLELMTLIVRHFKHMVGY